MIACSSTMHLSENSGLGSKGVLPIPFPWYDNENPTEKGSLGCCFFFFYIYVFISLCLAFKLLLASCGIQFPDQGSNPGACSPSPREVPSLGFSNAMVGPTERPN